MKEPMILFPHEQAHCIALELPPNKALAEPDGMILSSQKHEDSIIDSPSLAYEAASTWSIAAYYMHGVLL
jgi:hypothetical protein